MSTQPLLEVTGLSIAFGGVVALDRVDLAVGARELVSVIGPNGAGKTTLFNCICGLYRPDAGALQFQDSPLWPGVASPARFRTSSCSG